MQRKSTAERPVFSSRWLGPLLVGLAGCGGPPATAPEAAPRPFEGASLTYSLSVAWAAERGPHTRALDTFLRFVAAWWRDHMNPSWEDETGRNGKGQVNATQ